MRLLDRSILFNQERGRNKRDNNRNTFVIDHHPALRKLFGIFRELQNIVGLPSDFLSVMPEPPIICFRRFKSLKDHLVRAKLKTINVAVNGMVKCGRGGGSVEFVNLLW